MSWPTWLTVMLTVTVTGTMVMATVTIRRISAKHDDGDWNICIDLTMRTHSFTTDNVDPSTDHRQTRALVCPLNLPRLNRQYTCRDWRKPDIRMTSKHRSYIGSLPRAINWWWGICRSYGERRKSDPITHLYNVWQTAVWLHHFSHFASCVIYK